MKYRKLGGSDLEVSVIGQGTWAMGDDFFGEIDKDECIKAIHASIDAGVNFVDTAAGYGADGASEKVVGDAIHDRRDKVILSTKCGILRMYGEYIKCLSTTTIRGEIEDSLRRLRTDYIDLYHIHWPDYNFGIEGALDLLVELKKEGKIREIGVSNFSVDELKTGIERAGIVSVQPPFSMLNRVSVENGVIPFAIENGLGVTAYGSLGGGILTGVMEKPEQGGKEQRGAFYPFYEEPLWSKCQELIAVLRGVADGKGVSVAEISVAWAIAQPGITVSLMGGVRPEESAQNAKAADVDLTDEELKVIDDAYDRIMK
ncbi:MAG: aldo/keto reductase [Clostridiales bacterium]|nr:aldo/keto reductase [Clostridiales bacterium]